jgi:hydrogenase/urease accessory protein HupE
MKTAVVLVALVNIVGAAFAHTGGSTGYASLTVSATTVRYSLTLSPDALPAAVVEELQLIRTGDTRAQAKLLGMLGEKITIVADGTPCEATPGFVMPPSATAETVTLVVDFACARPPQRLIVRDDVFDAFGPDHHTLAKIEASGTTQQFAFQPDIRTAEFAFEGATRHRQTLWSFLRLGVHHIVIGYDHLLFLFALLLRESSLISLLKIVTAFTLAHSVTLGLAVLGLLTLPERLVEAVIALSIAFVAAENLVPRLAVSRRWVISFLFGLVHGFGFSSALRELELPPQGLLLSLLGFNVGAEVGQGLVVLVAIPGLILVRRTRWEPRVVLASSVAILVVGLLLFVERASRQAQGG